MKKVLIALLLLLQHVGYGQTLFSHMDGFGTAIDKCSSPEVYCGTFDILCTGSSSSCSAASNANRWFRIGTPHYVSPTTIGIVADGSPDNEHGEKGRGEGIFTNFNFIPGKKYIINVGIKGMTAASGSFPTQSAAIKLYSGNQLEETIYNNVCCQEQYLWNFNTTDPTTFGTHNWDYWGNRPTQRNTNTTAVDLIGSIVPGVFWSGTTTNYSITYTVPTSGIPPTIFALQTYLNHSFYLGTSSIKNVVEFEIDYIKIEEDCSAISNFDYNYSTFNPLDVDFWPNTFAHPAGYDWQFGDGTTSSVAGLISHTYPTYGNYSASLQIGSCLRKRAKLCLNEPVVTNYIPGNTDGVEEIVGNTNDTRPCNPHFKVYGSSEKPWEIRLSFEGSHTGPNAFVVDWGDGTPTSSYTAPVSVAHAYPTSPLGGVIPGTYKICLTAVGRCTTCIDICIEDINEYPTDGGDGGFGGQGKSTQTNIVTQNEQLVLNGIMPNPASTVVALQIDGKTAAKAKIKVFDITGKVVLIKDAIIDEGKNKIELDIAQLTPGLYMIEVNTNFDSVLRSKFLKE